MNAEKLGKFIADQRKALGMTQAELGISSHRYRCSSPAVFLRFWNGSIPRATIRMNKGGKFSYYGNS